MCPFIHRIILYSSHLEPCAVLWNSLVSSSVGINQGTMSDLDEQIERLKRCEYLKEAEVKNLCDKAREILIDESNVQRVDAPVTV